MNKISKEIGDKINDAIKYFDAIFGADDGDWFDCKNYVAQYSLEYEVFVMARAKLGTNPSKQDCTNVISDQMSDWDL